MCGAVLTDGCFPWLKKQSTNHSFEGENKNGGIIFLGHNQKNCHKKGDRQGWDWHRKTVDLNQHISSLCVKQSVSNCYCSFGVEVFKLCGVPPPGGAGKLYGGRDVRRGYCVWWNMQVPVGVSWRRQLRYSALSKHLALDCCNLHQNSKTLCVISQSNLTTQKCYTYF